MKRAVALGLLVGVAFAGGRLRGGPPPAPHPIPRPTASPPHSGSPLIRRVPLTLATVLTVDEQTGRVFVTYPAFSVLSIKWIKSSLGLVKQLLPVPVRAQQDRLSHGNGVGWCSSRRGRRHGR